MYINITKSKLIEKINSMSAEKVVEFILEEGLVLNLLDEVPAGVYRRAEGLDMVRCDGYGHFTHVNVTGDDTLYTISWNCYDLDKGDEWVQVLDNSYKAVPEAYAFTFRMNNIGERLG